MWCLSVARCATRFVWCARTFSRLNLGRARDLHHSLAIDRIHPRSGTTSLRTDTQLALSAIQDILVLVQNHIGTERQPAERAIAHASDGRRIGDARSDSKRTVCALPRGHTLAHLGVVVVLVQQWSARNICRLDFGTRQVGGATACPIRGRRRVCGTANVNVLGHLERGSLLLTRFGFT